MAKASKAPVEGAPTDKVYFEEWECKITVSEKGEPEAEKLKKTRDCVKVTEAEAEVINSGLLYGKNTYAKLLFKPE